MEAIAGTNSHISMSAGIVLLFISAIFSVVAGLKLRSTLYEYRRCRLGYLGERAVGHHLNRLAADGYRVYHDLQFEGFNIDHVLVGPSGVYSVETKTFKKGEGQGFPYRRLRWPKTHLSGMAECETG